MGVRGPEKCYSISSSPMTASTCRRFLCRAAVSTLVTRPRASEGFKFRALMGLRVLCHSLPPPRRSEEPLTLPHCLLQPYFRYDSSTAESSTCLNTPTAHEQRVRSLGTAYLVCQLVVPAVGSA